MNKKITHELIIPDNLKGFRLDVALAQLLPNYSRNYLQNLIKTNCVTLNQIYPKIKTLLQGGEAVTIILEPKCYAENKTATFIPLSIIYEDESIIIINKPAGLIVHPGAGQKTHTLLNALLFYAPDLKTLPRAGIVHRLDKETSGLLVIAKTQTALTSLLKQMRNRSITRVYKAVILGVPIAGNSINAPIGRHPIKRKQMAVIDAGKPAISHYRIIEKFQDYCFIEVTLETGRTHQIRVHMAHIRHPIVGDPLYNKRLQLPKKAPLSLITLLRTFKRQALHACLLCLKHPITNKTITFEAEMPEDMQLLLNQLRKDNPYAR